MEYKVLIKLYVPEIEQKYEMFIPVNKTIEQIIELLNNIVNENTFGIYPIKNNLNLCNRRNGKIYKYFDIIRNTDIRNGTELVLY